MEGYRRIRMAISSNAFRPRREKGQAMSETAIILPLFIFMLLGTLQLGLIYQARYLLKYAAYRASRMGALQNACDEPMRDAALSVLAPIIGTGISLERGARWSQGEGYSQTDNIVNYEKAIARSKALAGPSGAPILDVIVCGPTTEHLKGASLNEDELDFDDPRNLLWENRALGKETLRQFERTKLRVQVQYLHQLIIPFANWIIFYSWTGMNLLRELRMQTKYTNSPNIPGVVRTGTLSDDQGNGHRNKAEHLPVLVAHAQLAQRYFLPLHANYSFRMQSNLFPQKDGCRFPEENLCWHYLDGEDGAI